MEKVFSIEELITTDSFINYCYLKNTEDVFRWNHYLLQHPQERKTVDEARTFVFHLEQVLLETEKEEGWSVLERQYRTRVRCKAHLENHDKVRSLKELSHRKGIPHVWFIAAASIVAIILLAAVIVGNEKERQPVVLSPHNNAQKNENAPLLLEENGFVRTMAGEKKHIFLPDGSKVTMNAKSSLHLDSAFGKNARVVHLEGEAFFDVAHRKRSPFIVKLKDYDVKVMGTMFNVRSYTGDKISETALVKGEVQIILKKGSVNRLTLKPNEKAVVSASSSGSRLQGNSQERIKSVPDISIVIKPLTIGNDGSSVVETGWMQNRLEINDETFEELKTKLERWYGVEISFADNEVKYFRFTATFEKESIEQALRAMQLTYPFQFSTNSKNQIWVGK